MNEDLRFWLYRLGWDFNDHVGSAIELVVKTVAATLACLLFYGLAAGL
ncbi:hypothetical protein LCGC14_2296080 [marine sediment metagenome]|uniref:Uncharacterized protein n=1 Tax=marine sediment metagenome TaxID=412755 RepID=A0A0F9FJZ0_9ZZZZ